MTEQHTNWVVRRHMFAAASASTALHFFSHAPKYNKEPKRRNAIEAAFLPTWRDSRQIGQQSNNLIIPRYRILALRAVAIKPLRTERTEIRFVSLFRNYFPFKIFLCASGLMYQVHFIDDEKKSLYGTTPFFTTTPSSHILKHKNRIIWSYISIFHHSLILFFTLRHEFFSNYSVVSSFAQ